MTVNLCVNRSIISPQTKKVSQRSTFPTKNSTSVKKTFKDSKLFGYIQTVGILILIAKTVLLFMKEIHKAGKSNKDKGVEFSYLS